MTNAQARLEVVARRALCKIVSTPESVTFSAVESRGHRAAVSWVPGGKRVQNPCARASQGREDASQGIQMHLYGIQ